MARIENLIRENAQTNVANGNVIAETHNKVCKQIVAFADAHKNIPMYFILQVGISKGAYQQRNYDKGYRTFDAAKVETVYNFGRAYYDYNGLHGKINDIAIRLIMAFVERVSEDADDFAKFLNNSEVLGKRAVSRDVELFVLQRNLGVVDSNLPLTAKQKAIIKAKREKARETWLKQETKSLAKRHKIA